MASLSLTRHLERTLQRAYAEAADRRECCTVEHLLHELLDDKNARGALTTLGASRDRLRERLQEFLKTNAKRNRALAADGVADLGISSLLQRSAIQVVLASKKYVHGGHVLIQIFEGPEASSYACRLLKEEQISQLDLKRCLPTVASEPGPLKRVLSNLVGSLGQSRGQEPEPHADVDQTASFKVVFHNDDFTTQLFVVETLTMHFGVPETAAEELMLQVHTEGSAAVGSFSREEAEQKISAVHAEAEAQGFPLRLTLAPAKRSGHQP